MYKVDRLLSGLTAQQKGTTGIKIKHLLDLEIRVLFTMKVTTLSPSNLIIDPLMNLYFGISVPDSMVHARGPSNEHQSQSLGGPLITQVNSI